MYPTTPHTPRRWLIVGAILITLAPLGFMAAPAAQTVAEKQRVENVRRALQRLPYYGVFDFLAFRLERGEVTLMGYAYAPNLRSDAEEAVERVPGIDGVTNKIEVLPASINDDRIRRATFYNIYTDDFLSRYAPGGAMQAHYDALQFGRFPGMQPFGTYPIHIIVTGGRVTLVGVVANQGDKQIAGVRARDVTGTFAVENELIVEK